MFETLSERLSGALKSISGKSKITEDNIQESLREVRRALLEADVALPVVKDFIEQVKHRAIGQEVSSSLNPGQAFLKIVQAELQALMGNANEALDLKAVPPAVILMAGLQGAGKTTSVAKLALWLKNNQKKSVMVVSADVYRPAAIQQLEMLATEVGIEFFPSDPSQSPEQIVRAALAAAKKQFVVVLFVDTAGRLAIDEAMMEEIKGLHQLLKPAETLFVVDAMTGQDAANTAKAFNDALPLSGVILTKTDGDARGGAALSVRQITGKPIKFLGTGEKIDGLEPFYPDRWHQEFWVWEMCCLSLKMLRRKSISKKPRGWRKKSNVASVLIWKISRSSSTDAEYGGIGNLLEKCRAWAVWLRQRLDGSMSACLPAWRPSSTP